MISMRIFSFSQRRWSWSGALLAGALVLFGLLPAGEIDAASTEPRTLRVGVFPYLSTRILLATYEPMRTYLEGTLQRPVRIYTATSYREYFQLAVQGAYDLAIFPPHLALLAQRDAELTPIARFTRVMHGIFVTTIDSPITSLEQLRGMQLATPDSVALVTMLGINQLATLGMRPSRDYVWRPGVSHNSALLNLQRGTAQVALVSNAAIRHMPPTQQENLRVLGRTEDFPALIFMTRKHLAPETGAALQNALLKWPQQPAGADATETLQFSAIVRLGPDELELYKIYLNSTREALNAAADEAARR